jgi:hypothetical protein
MFFAGLWQLPPARSADRSHEGGGSVHLADDTRERFTKNKLRHRLVAARRESSSSPCSGRGRQFAGRPAPRDPNGRGTANGPAINTEPGSFVSGSMQFVRLKSNKNRI